MSKSKLPFVRVLALAIATTIVSSPSLADKGGKGHDKGGQAEERGERGEKGRPEAKGGGDRGDKGPGQKVARIEHFGDPHRAYVHDYYDGQFRAGRCPPGLAKKHNGCLPPGQAKKWDVGYVLPKDVRYYDVPPPLVQQLGTPPVGYRYVRVDDNILLLATGTRMVVDAIRALGR